MKTLFAFLLTGCQKTVVAPPVNTDVTNSIFRVVANSDANYSISVVISAPAPAVPDTLSIVSTANTPFSYGFSVATGTTVAVSADTKKGTKLQCQIFYKGKELGPATFNTSAAGISASFNYMVGN